MPIASCTTGYANTKDFNHIGLDVKILGWQSKNVEIAHYVTPLGTLRSDYQTAAEISEEIKEAYGWQAK